jgi:cell division protein FtsI (penicillin-binding protein 3)
MSLRTPLRPLARILKARQKGENPDTIERENIRLRHEEMHDRSRLRAEGRLLVLGVFFIAAFAVVGVRMGVLARSEPAEPHASGPRNAIMAQRADIVDRNGRILATNLQTYALYAQPPAMIDPERVAAELVKVFPDLETDELTALFTGKRKFVWIKKRISPEQMQQVHDIGDPGLEFGPREMRLYPNGRLAAHILGGARFGREGVNSAEVVGVAGVEKQFDDALRDPANNGAALQLSIDLSVQASMREVLYGGMKLMNARGAAAVLMDVKTGEVLSMVSLPDFDPNTRPAPLIRGLASDSPLFNRAVQGLYELGSVYKTFAMAQALDEGLIKPDTIIDIRGPLRMAGFSIRDFSNYGKELSATDVLVKSSNIGIARISELFGGERQKAFLKTLGLIDPTSIELIEASRIRPLLPENWSELSTMTIAYGHGISGSPLQLASAYSSVVNGGTFVTPTLLKQTEVAPGPRVISEKTSKILTEMLRQVVVRGTASFGDVPGYAVGGKTGTADKAKEMGGGYYEDKVINSFASVFPAYDPQYVLVVTLDEPSENSGLKPRRTAGWTAVPIVAEMIRRTAPLLGLRPEVEPEGRDEVLLTSN